MTTNNAAAAPSIASAFITLIGTAGGFIALVAIGFVGGVGALMTMM